MIMLEIRKTAVAFDEEDLMDLERIIVDGDKSEAMRFLKKNVYDRIVHAQRAKLKSHLDSGASPIEGFLKGNIR